MERLPTELLYHIGQYSREEEPPFRTLWALSLCSWRFYHVFKPLLYSEIRITYDGYRIPLHDVDLIIRLWHDAELAKRVHRLDIHWQGCGSSDLSKFEDESKIVAFINSALDEIFGSNAPLYRTRDKWEHHLQARCQEAWAGILLVRLSHLRRLFVKYDNSDLIVDILRKAAQRQQPFDRTLPFPYLTEVTASAHSRLHWIESDLLTSFFYFPAVRRVNVFAVAETAAPESLVVKHDSLPVRVLVVSNAVYCRGMLDWLAASARLEQVTLKIAVHPTDDYWDMPSNERFHASRFRQALLPCAKTLRSLRLEGACSYKVVWYNEDRDEDEEAAFGSFKEFANLQTLIVRYHFLLAPPSADDKMPLLAILPASLESLGITDIESEDYLNLVAELLRLVRHGPDLFPRLNEVHLFVIDMCEGPLDALRTGFDLAGIGLTVELQQEEDWEHNDVSSDGENPFLDVEVQMVGPS
ncbi:uncharacterized protein BO66DRAFT_400001 [Aspergillus aculeatinus CBS 121060]|uniref:Uncharacterized protein n=1 Tax=Aspergillus aculeatinus CBS 121060 TaxID=1448322 RepID=A0ACD1HEK8_9EURO|nr:hypothetical protein BO66DRAFT_400001 [Aspergillus aculeatinus CBS 121060]RAH71910.1 hypothetical protein BO66DRAFT_400001 [Aspergillus aculeatinus CBS 121060]